MGIANITNNILTDSGTAISSLQPTITLTTTGTSGAATFASNTLNIPNYGGALTGYVPYTGATTDVVLGTNNLKSKSVYVEGDGAFTSGALFLKQYASGATNVTGYNIITTQTSGFLFSASVAASFKNFILDASSLTDVTQRTYTLPNASGTLALTSDIPSLTGYVTLGTAQTITAIKTFSAGIVANVTTGGAQGFASTNSSASGSSIFLQNNSTVIGNAIGINNTSTADGIAIGNETSGRGIYISNATISGSGKGISIDNYNSGIGIEVGSDSTADAIKVLHLSGRAFNIQSSGGGFGVIINNTTASTSSPFTIQKQGANRITFTDAGAGTFVSTISAAGATLTGALSGTSATFSGSVTVAGNIFTLNDAVFSTAGSITKHSVIGLALKGVAGSVFDFSVYSPSGNAIISNPTGTNNIGFGGAITVASSVTATNGILRGDLGTGVEASLRLRGSNATARTTRLQFEDYNGTIADAFLDFKIPTAGSSTGARLDVGVNSPALSIVNGGNVGIGTTAPTAKLEVNGFGTANSIMTYVTAKFYGSGTGGLNIGTDGTNPMIGPDVSGTDIVFLKRVAGVYSEAVRIASTGTVAVDNNLQVASSLTNGKINIGALLNAGTNGINIQTFQSPGGGNFIQFLNLSGNSAGNITHSGTTTVSYNTSSDYRLKEDLKPIKGLEIVNKIKVYDYKWKDEDRRMDGVLAHELQEVLPYAVNGIKDGLQMQGVDYSKIVPVMVQAIKELKAELDTLKNK
jgi:hypothetical protein